MKTMIESLKSLSSESDETLILIKVFLVFKPPATKSDCYCYFTFQKIKPLQQSTKEPEGGAVLLSILLYSSGSQSVFLERFLRFSFKRQIKHKQ